MTLKEFFEWAPPNVERKGLRVATYVMSSYRAARRRPDGPAIVEKLLKPNIKGPSASRIF